MPRLRYYKNFNWSDDHDTSDDETTDNASGNSWLSNANIVALLSEAKIKQAILNLKAQISVLEAELVSRHSRISNSPLDGEFKIGRLRPIRNGEKPRRVTGRATKTPKLPLTRIRATLSKLGIKDVDSLLAQWGQINEKGAKSDK